MERAIAEMEKIKKAEEIYSRRRNLDLKQENENRPKSIYKYLFQILVLFNIIVIVIAVQNKNYIFTDEFISKVSKYNVNIKNKIEEIFKYESSNEIIDNNNPQNSVQNVEDTNNKEAISGKVNETQGALVENEIKEESDSNEKENTIDNNENKEELSQMQIDANNIKEKYSIILPVTGTKTSGFGNRESNNSIVTSYHTGVDIAAAKGTIIKSATTGKVTLVSSEGDYGKHLKISTDNLTIIYAHCSKIYVKDGDTITQGQDIAEVGSTGNSTGPHLHFEIRYEDRYVDPELIVQI